MSMERIKILIAITERENGKGLVEWMAKRGAGYQIRFSGQGTASSEMMDILGLGSSEKDIVVSFGKQSVIEAVTREFTDSMASVRRGRGIMMMMSPNAMSNLAAAMLSMQPTPELREGDEPMKNEHKHSLILISVNQGYTDQVMQTARHAGATGGTIVKARLAADDASEQFQGFDLQPEKQVIAILAADSIKAKVMEDVNEKFGLTSEAQGLVFSLPVDKAFKI